MNTDEDTVVLYDYWRSSASYRVRIALNMLGIKYEAVQVDILKGEHRQPAHMDRNVQGLVPALHIDGRMLTQSLAIIEYLDETRDAAKFLPVDPVRRQRLRALSYAIAMDIHPICNSHVGIHVMELAGEEARRSWMKKFISQGLEAVDAMLDHPDTGLFCQGDEPGMADFCLIPQIYNAQRWGADIGALKRVLAIGERCSALGAFMAAHPESVRPQR